MSSYLRRITGKSITLNWLLGIAVGAFLSQIILLAVFSGDANPGESTAGFLQIFQLPVSFREFIHQPWSLFTWWLAHPLQYFLPFVLNCLFIFMFGGVLVSLVGEMKFRSLIIFSLLACGVITFLLSAAFVPDVSKYDNPSAFLLYHNSHAYGMSALMASIITATITLAPKYPVRVILFGNIPIIWIGLILLALRYLSIGTLQNTPELIALTVGGLLGVGHILLLRRGTDITAWTLFPWGRNRRRKPKLEVVRSPARKTIIPKRQKVKETPEPEMEVDKILDKINEVGYEGLSRKEKEFLEKASRE